MTTNEEYETHHEEYLRKQKQLVKDDLQDEHSALVLDFLYHRDESLEPSTARNYARELRFLIRYTYENEGWDASPEEWGSKDWNRLIQRVSRERGIKDGTKRNTCYAARAFIDWSVDSPADKSEIDAPKTKHSKIDEETVLKAEEVVNLIETTRTARDAAVIAVMYEAALRRTALVQLDVKHYKEDPFPRIEIPHRIGVKTGSGRERPINWSQGYLDNWMANHPNADDPDAPLFCSIRKRDNHSRLSSHAIYTMMQRTADRCDDVENERVHPHALRHSRATSMRKSDQFDKNDVELIMGWTDSTPMHERYEHATSMEEATRTAQKMGIDVGGDDDSHIQDCPRCNTRIPPNSRYCPTCTLKIDGTPPDWWQLYTKLCKDTDPIRKEYGALPSAVPEIDNMSTNELDHIQDIFVLGYVQTHYPIDLSKWKDHPYDQINAVTEEEAEKCRGYIEKINDKLASIYQTNPDKFAIIDGIDDEKVEQVKNRVEDETEYDD